MYDSYNFMSQQTGFDFEDAMIDALKTVATVEHATKQQDTFEGTDAFVDKVRMDFTLHYEGKAKTQKVGEWKDFLIGIRTGNGKRQFKEPVLVIGLNVAPSFAKQYIIPRIKTEIGDMRTFLDEAFGLYWDWMDEHPEYDL